VPNPVVVSGSVSGLTGVCPLLTFSASGSNVTTSPATQYSGTSCVGLKQGDTVEVHGSPGAGGTIVADQITKR
jgi:hypothetical protein